MTGLSARGRPDHHARRLAIAASVAGLQALAAIYFLVDAVGESHDGSNPLGLLDGLVALALLAGIGFGALAVRRLLADARRHERALDAARGALGELIRERFGEWRLSPSEADVALFALKGCTVAEIAEMRGAASGTVRSQLSQVYAKAGVAGQPMLMSLFLEDLLGEAATA
ncbi:helix-turn-helix transcriptional regulator [Altererythrobacter salegens]|uniref:Helix-turn-helix transcriptional regulator n=1 Tax=Croceibacterium salegens TaxID=1737568 RepID=A0A6I4SZH5_9SPHN|nr:helix-turn-helix transcriptional regulator [Croceibacterium salegens]MXO60437.1 helix-turn-helix transcriptional regulator [Croceibacterium salegens]